MDTLRLRIDTLAYGGDGIGRHENIVYFVPFSAPGDLLEVKITRKEKSYRKAEIVKILEPSASRRTAPCEYFGTCGGCQWQHIGYNTQLAEKERELRSAFLKTGQDEAASKIQPVTGSDDEFHYRRIARFKLHKNRHSGRTEKGFYKRASNQFMRISECMLLDKRLDGTEVPPFKGHAAGLDAWLDDSGSTNTLIRYSEKDPGADFVQVNSRMNEKLQKIVFDAVTEHFGTRAFNAADLFCGDGNLSLQLHDRASSINGWDYSINAIRKANEGAALKGSSNCRIEYHERNIDHSINRILGEIKKSDCLIIDPPRRGLKKHAAAIAELKVPLVIYVSCSPPDLVRDLKYFSEQAYETALIQPLDMFPQTYHLETVCVLKKSG